MKKIDSNYINQAVDLLHKQYLQTIKIHDYTVQLSEVLSRNDNVSAQMFMNMRQDCMIAVDELASQVQALIYSMPEDVQERMVQLTSRNWKDLYIQDDAETKVGEEVEKIQRQLEKTIAIDKALNQRIGGPNSYYQ